MPKKYATEEERKAAAFAAKRRYADSGKKKAAQDRRKAELGEDGVKRRREYALAYYYSNLEKCRAQSTSRKRLHGQSEQEKLTARESLLFRKFGITSEDYEALLIAQNGVCAICRNHCPSGRRLAVDHCHTSGIVRGLLCTPCNTAIGLVKESPLLLQAMLSYLEKFRC